MRNQRGEGLISVLISVAILGILVVTLVSLYQIYGAMMNKSLLRREADNLIYKVRGQISRRVMCQASLAGNTWDGTTDTDIVIRDGSGVIAQTGMPLAGGHLLMNRVFIRRFQVDTNADNVRENIDAVAPATVGEADFRAQGGEIVIQFRLAGAAVGTGELAERRAAVMVIVDPVAPFTIRDCDVNEESTHYKICNMPQDALDDGFPCGPPPVSAAECSPYIYVGSIDATGESKCHCTWSCALPFYQDRQNMGVCSANTSLPGTECPAETKSGPPDKGYCAGLLNSHCFWKVIAPVACPPGGGPPGPRYLLMRATCLLP